MIECPYCGEQNILKGLRPGEFAPTCPHCQQRFDLIVPSDPNGKAIARESAVKHSSGERLGVTTAGVDRPAASVRKDVPRNSPKQLSGRLGGYEIKKLLGRGTMGSVYLARQLSLSRLVAIKTLHKTLAADPRVLARFTREAYAAAMLQHPNIVQIYDFGSDRGIHYFSMEYVKGISLMQLLHQQGKLNAHRTAGYLLQAARGLAFAHQHGLVHRDVKPDNLLLGDNGIVKIADLGLVRQMAVRNRPEMAAVGGGTDANPNATQRYHAMGTPTYMSPEQAMDSAVVDARADIYSLGCTMYMLLVGHPPFEEKTTQAMLEAHATRQATPPDLVVESVPAELSTIVMRMMARKPSNRFQSMQDVMAALENYLELEGGGAAELKENEVESISAAAERVRTSPWPKIQMAMAGVFFLICAIGVAVSVMVPRSSMQKSLSLAAVLTVALATTLTHLAIRGAAYHRPLFVRLQQMWMRNGWVELLNFKFVIPFAMLALVLYAMNLVWIGLALVVVSIFLGIAAHVVVDRPAEAIKAEAAREAETVLREMRERGIDEQVIRQVVRSESGAKWRGLFESIFGYDAAAVSAAAADPSGNQQRWLDRLMEKANAKMQHRWEIQKRQLLASLEAQWRIGAGINATEARQEAMQTSDEFVRGANVVRQMAHQAAIAAAMAANGTDNTKSAGANAPASEARFVPRDWTDRPADLLVEFTADVPGRPMRRKKLDYLGALEGYERNSFFRRRFGSPIEIIFSAGPRLILAMLILAAFAAWSIQNKGKTLNHFLMASSSGAIEPLHLAMLPTWLCEAVSGFGALVAGVILGLSVFFVGRVYAMCVVLGAAVWLLGPVFYTGPHTVVVISTIAAAIVLLGMLMRRTVE